MPAQHKFRLKQLLATKRSRAHTMFGCMRGTVSILGDIVSPVYTDPWDAELGIAYHGENGPVYWFDSKLSSTDDCYTPVEE